MPSTGNLPRGSSAERICDLNFVCRIRTESRSLFGIRAESETPALVAGHLGPFDWKQIDDLFERQGVRMHAVVRTKGQEGEIENHSIADLGIKLHCAEGTERGGGGGKEKEKKTGVQPVLTRALSSSEIWSPKSAEHMFHVFCRIIEQPQSESHGPPVRRSSQLLAATDACNN